MLNTVYVLLLIDSMSRDQTVKVFTEYHNAERWGQHWAESRQLKSVLAGHYFSFEIRTIPISDVKG